MAAGLGYKEFTTGDVLTAADANGYLASQVVMVFADAADRTADLTSPEEGMISYLKDTNAVEKYDGAAWVSVGGGGGGGKVLQVVQGSTTTNTTTSSATYADTNLTATITPSSATSKVLVFVMHNGVGKEGNIAGRVRLLRASTEIMSINTLIGYTATSTANYVGDISTVYLDTPNTTSATTYKTQFASDNGAAFAVQVGGGGLASTSTITLMEIGA
jgi:hypothetical protein